MSKRMEYDWSTADPGRGRSKYPWREWADGETWGVDPAEFGVTHKQLRTALHQRASIKSMKVRTRNVGELTVFQFYTVENAPA